MFEKLKKSLWGSDSKIRECVTRTPVDSDALKVRN